MTPVVCPHCQRTNPNHAVYCYFDGLLLRAGSTPAQQQHKLAQDFYFPSGRKCHTFDDLLQGCQEEWLQARELLMGGVFQQFFSSTGRLDIARSCQEAISKGDPDIALANFLGSLPASQAVQGPKLDLSPRRLALGKMQSGERRRVTLNVFNRGHGTLQGSITLVDGGNWITLGDKGAAEAQIRTQREQQIVITIDTRNLPAAQTYAAKLRVVTNGGVVEAPLQVEVVAIPYPRDPFRGSRTPRELAQKMRANPKAAVPVLESGEVAKWFAGNGWKYPIRGTPAKGVASVQQFFEAMGLSRPPKVALSQNRLKLNCTPPTKARAQIALQTSAKKFVYGSISSDLPWLRVMTSEVSGAQQAPISLEVDPVWLPKTKSASGMLQIIANGGQELQLRVDVDIVRKKPNVLSQLVVTVVLISLSLAFFRLLVSPLVDGFARPVAVRMASERAASDSPTANATVRSFAGWLQLPWYAVFTSNQYVLPENFFGEGISTEITDQQNFRDYVVSNFVFYFVVYTWWLPFLAWLWHLYKKHGWKDAIWGVLSGVVLGVIVSATVACGLLLIDTPALSAFSLFLGSSSPSVMHLVLWIGFVTIFWFCLGILLALVLTFLGPVSRPIINQIDEISQSWLARPAGQTMRRSHGSLP